MTVSSAAVPFTESDDEVVGVLEDVMEGAVGLSMG